MSDPENEIPGDGFRACVSRAVTGRPLSEKETEAAFGMILGGGARPVQIAAFLTALAVRGETPAEITAAARMMRAKSTRFQGPEDAIDCCGTGGDGAHTLNISTAVAFVLAACGLPVAKHGNRAASSQSGAADILAALGVNIMIPPDRLQSCLEEIGICFLFAQTHHPAMRHVAPVRAEMGIRTIFNNLGPLTNPAGARFQLLGVYDKALCRPMAEALKALGSKAAWVVHGSDGLDELTVTGASHVTALDGAGQISSFDITPEEAGLPRAAAAELKGGTPTENAAALTALFDGAKNAYRDIVLLNAAAGLVIAGRADTLRDGAHMAATTIDTGAAGQKLTALAARTSAP